MERRKYSREFKLEAVNLVRQRDVSIVQAARDLDVRDRLGGVNSKFERAQELEETKSTVAFVAAELLSKGQPVSIRSIAKALGVNATTVMRWYPESDFAEFGKALSQFRKKTPARGKQV